MTTVTFHTEGSAITGFDAKGHSGFAQEGEDIVCAAITSAVRLVECTVNDVMGLCAAVKVREKDAFLSALSSAIEEAEAAPQSDEIVVDAQIPAEYMTEGLWRLSELIEPCGQENGSLMLYIKGARIVDILPTRGDRRMMRLTVSFGRFSWPAVWWSPHDNDLFTKGSAVDIVFTPDTNYWKGQSKMQMVIEEMEAVDSIGS